MEKLGLGIVKVLFLVTILLFPFCSKKDSNGPTLNDIFNFPSQVEHFGSPISWDGSHLWMTGGNSTGPEYCYRVSTSGQIVSSFEAPGGKCGAIAWDGNHLWVHNGEFNYYTHWPEDVTIYQLTTSGEIISSFHSPVDYPGEIIWDGSCLWIYSCLSVGSSFGDWYKVNTSGEILGSFRPSSGNWGAAWDGQYIWCVTHCSKISPTEGRYSNLFKINISGGIIESYRFDDEQFWGLAYDGNDFWVISCNKGSTICRICKISVL